MIKRGYKMQDIKILKREYDKLKKRYRLPDFEDLDEDFEIRTLDVDKCGILIKAILRSILNRFNSFLGYIDPIINPNPNSMHSMLEIKYISDKDKEDIFKQYKDILYLLHIGLLAELSGEQESAKFIKDIWKVWLDMKSKELKTLKIIANVWNIEDKKTKITSMG